MTDFQYKRGTDAQISNYIGAEGEPVYNTDTGRVHIMDGVTSGGVELALLSDVGSGDGGGSTPTVFEDFESDLTGYSAYDGSASVSGTGAYSITTSPVKNGSQALSATGASTAQWLLDADETAPAPGDTFRWWMRGTSGMKRISMAFGVQDVDNLYIAGIRVDTGDIDFFTRSGSSYNSEGTAVAGIAADTWYEGEVTWASDGTIDNYRVLDESGSELASLSVSSPTATYSSGGYGWYTLEDTGGTSYFDYARTV